MHKGIQSEIADMKNVGPAVGEARSQPPSSSRTQADAPWVHLDIAGLELDHESRPYIAKGANPLRVRTLVQLVT